MKKLIGLFFAFIAIFVMVSCGNKKGDSTNNNVTRLDAPVLTLTDNVVTWDAVENAGGYVVKVNDAVCDEQTETTYTIIATEVGNYTITVKAIPADTTLYKESYYSEAVVYTKTKATSKTLWVLGDSTSCSFENESADQKKYYPRYGYGTQLANYFNDVTVKNIAVSGRSSGSYFTESTSKLKYDEFTSEIAEGDYVLIAFGHNEQNTDQRYSDPTLASDDSQTRTWKLEGTDATKYPVDDDGNYTRPVSFKYLLTHYYIDVALAAGANPMLATPIVRRNPNGDTLSSSQCHVWAGSEGYTGGDYAQCIRDLAAEKDIPLIDNTSMTKEKYEQIGSAETLYMHAWVNSKQASVDNTHLNIYGAKWVAYKVAKAISALNITLSENVKNDIIEPTKANDLVINPNYKETTYEAPTSELSIFEDLTTDPWQASAFGYLGGKPTNDNYVVTESGTITNTSSNVRLQVKNNKGKIAGTADGILMYYQQIAATTDFTLSCTLTIIAFDNNTQVGFGAMIRDDMYTDIESVNDSSIASNCVVAGSAVSNATTLYSTAYRKDTTLNKGATTTIATNTAYNLSIVKSGNTYTVKFADLDAVTYTVDLADIDQEYVYAGVYAARNCTVEFTNITIA